MTGSIIEQPSSLTASTPQHDLSHPNLNVVSTVTESHNCPTHFYTNKASGDQRGQLSTCGPTKIGPTEAQASNTLTLGLHSGPGAARERSSMSTGRPATSEYTLCLDARADQCAELFWVTVRE